MQSESLGISAAEAAALLGVSESHFYCLHKTGRLGPLPVRMGRAVRWSRRELIDWFNAGSPSRNRWLAKGKEDRSP
jgi:excisionase family DNA binding protein